MLCTVSVGLAPFFNHFNANASLMLTSGAFTLFGLYVPICSMLRSSRGSRASAATIRYNGFLFEPKRVKRNLTAIYILSFNFHSFYFLQEIIITVINYF